MGLRPALKAFKCGPDNQLIIRVETRELEGGHGCNRPSEFAWPLYEVAPDWIQQRLGLGLVILPGTKFVIVCQTVVTLASSL